MLDLGGRARAGCDGAVFADERRCRRTSAYLGRHPGGPGSILCLAGRDATQAFAAACHSTAAVFQCGDWDIGPITNGRRLRAAAAKVRSCVRRHVSGEHVSGRCACAERRARTWRIY
mmetsp:Transcript_7877/g.23867  ORF Transcript_7877/g.23867 Transcript_7877/m.23867 type:complete len:117 (-) Transcript_7877:1-351(-)